jgi:NAD(P)-dependent dehydrogenase (short-subunit alcohol dehydrogenase family)
MKSLVWFITGASRGFGLEIARAALERGDAVVAAARDPKVVEIALGQRDKLLSVELDVTDERQAQASVRAALARFGQIDVLVTMLVEAYSVPSRRRRPRKSGPSLP